MADFNLGDLFSYSGQGTQDFTGSPNYFSSPQGNLPQGLQWMQDTPFNPVNMDGGKGWFAGDPGTLNDSVFGALIDTGLGAVTGGFGIPGAGFGAGLGLTGGAASAASGALAGGMSAAGNGGNFFQGALSGGLGGGLSGLNLAGSAGVTNPILNTAANQAIGGTAQGLAGGRSLSDSLQSGAVAGATSGFTQGMNQLGRTFLPDIMGSIFGSPSSDSTGMSSASNSLPMLSSNPANNASFPQGQESLYQQITGSPQDISSTMASYSPDNQPLYNQVTGTQQINDPGVPNKKIQSLSDLAQNPSLANAGRFVGNNAGDLGSMIYGLYNMQKQKKQMSQMMGGLQGLYNPNGAYATQLRNTLMAKDAASGHRSNYAGRETQLMAELAGKNAQMMPGMMQMQNTQNSLGNNQMNLFLQGMNKLGGWDGLKTLFNGNGGGG